VRDGGLLSCVRTDTGRVIYRERLGAPGQYSASPVIANGCVYLVSSGGVLTIVKTGDEFKILHQADLGAAVHGTPAIDRDTLYVRTVDALRAFR
jgi:outer membrane protein assembly factor BamB